MGFRDARGDFDVETILPIIVQIVTGILGGQAVGGLAAGGDDPTDENH
jgi:hypothetical protein